MQVRREIDITTETQKVHAVVWLQAHMGAMSEENWGGSGGGSGLGLIFLWFVFEVADIVASTGAAAVAIVDPDYRVTMGPFGWFLALFPFVTLISQPLPDLPDTIGVDDQTFISITHPRAETRVAAMTRILSPIVQVPFTVVEVVPSVPTPLSEPQPSRR